MITKFKVGDRVRVYGHSAIGTDISNCIFTVSKYYAYDNYLIVGNLGNEFRVHYKQCRKLIKKPKNKLYVVIPTYSVYSVTAFFDKSEAEKFNKLFGNLCKIVEFTEAKKK